MEKIQEFASYMKELKLKKTMFGGYSKKDVAQKMEKMMELFLKCVEEYEQEEQKLIEDYERRMAIQSEKIGELNIQVAEKEKMKAAYKESCTSILAEYSNSIRALSAQFTNVMENVTKNVEKLQRGLDEDLILEKIEVLDEE